MFVDIGPVEAARRVKEQIGEPWHLFNFIIFIGILSSFIVHDSDIFIFITFSAFIQSYF